MNRMKKILALSLSVLTCFGSLGWIAGCNSSSSTDEEENKEIVSTEEESKEIIFANFEQWGPDFQLMRLINNFGKVTRNEDANYVKEGKYSAKLRPMGGYLTSSIPLLYLPTNSVNFSYNYSDFTQFERISAYMYNAEDRALNATIGLVSSIGSPTTVSTLPGDTVYLAPKVWTKIDYWLELDFLNLAADVTSIKGVYFQFENAGVEYPDDAPTVYLDDVRLVKADVQQTVKDLIVLDENEVCDFEKDYQKYIMQAERAGSVNETFEMDVVTATDYGIVAPSGEKVLRLLRHPSQSSGASKLMLPENLMKRVGLDKIPEDDYKKTYFCFDMIGGVNAKNEYLGTKITTSGGRGSSWLRRIVRKKGEYTLTTGGVSLDKGVVGQWAPWNYSERVGPQGWTTYKISLYEIAGWLGSDYVKDVGYFCINIGNYQGTEDRELFFDNFRIETGDELYVDSNAG